MPGPDLQHPPQAERAATIRDAVAGAGEVTHFVPAENGYLEVPVIELDHRLLVYRADNGRVLSELTDAALARAASLDDLKARSESAEVQALLHDLLIEKARDPHGPIYAELERYGRQTEPLIIREDGVVLNGNRRLAAMRDLQDRESDSYGQFGSVRAAVLPAGLSKHEIEFIEAALQMAPDLKLDYSWINRRLKLRQHMADMNLERVMEAYRFSDPADGDRELAQLALAEQYLEWIGQPRHFVLVADQEDAFTALQAQLTSMSQSHLADIWRWVGFAMIKTRPNLDRKIMHYFPFTDPVPPAMRNWVPRSLAEDHGIVERQAAGENRRLDPAAANRLLPLVGDPEQARNTALAGMALVDTLKGNQDRLIGFSRLMALLRNANQTLEDIKVEELTDEQIRRIRAQLAALQQYTGPVTQADEAQYRAEMEGPGLRSTVRKTWNKARRLIE